MIVEYQFQDWATAAHPYNLEVNGVDHIGAVDFRTIDIEMAGPGTNGSLTFELWDPTASVTISEWDEVRFIEHAATPRPILFGGFVQSIRYTAWAAAGRSITVQCVGYGILLDKKAVPEQPYPADISYWPEELIARLVNLYGGRVTATATSGVGVAPNESGGWSPQAQRWQIGQFWGAATAADTWHVYLRDSIESLLTTSADSLDSTVEVFVPMTGVYWVDSAAMFRLLLDGWGSSAAVWQPPGGGTNSYQTMFDGGTSGFAFDSAGTYVIEKVEYEKENQDQVTSVYVKGGDANGTGFSRPIVGRERAGDLEAIVDEPNSTSASHIRTTGAGVASRTTFSTTRGAIDVSSTTPLSIWPGRYMTVDMAQIGISASDVWRALSVRIRWRSSASRVYEIGFGLSANPYPKLTHREAKKKKRGRVK